MQVFFQKNATFFCKSPHFFGVLACEPPQNRDCPPQSAGGLGEHRHHDAPKGLPPRPKSERRTPEKIPPQSPARQRQREQKKRTRIGQKHGNILYNDDRSPTVKGQPPDRKQIRKQPEKQSQTAKQKGAV